MNKDNQVPIEGHDYDGIQELDNPLPRWWLVTWYGAMIFAVFYIAYVQLGPGPLPSDTLAKRMAEVNAAQQQTVSAQQAEYADIDVAGILGDDNAMAQGKVEFTGKCSACHGNGGEGSVGPNLTDSYWIHGKGDVRHVLESIRQGYPEKGMPPWGQLINEELHVPLAVYVMSLKGTKPPNPKEPQGEFVAD